jgi:hypothetical protein
LLFLKMRATFLGWRLLPQQQGPEIFVQLQEGEALLHQGLRVAPAALLPPAADFARLAALVRAAAPSTFGLASASAVASLLRALAAALAAAAPPPPPPPPAALPSALAGIGDLQRVGPAMLQAAKAKMDVVFQAHQVARTDPAFVYDKRVEFAPASEAEPSDWD